jgi:hypothetical protein
MNHALHNHSELNVWVCFCYLRSHYRWKREIGSTEEINGRDITLLSWQHLQRQRMMFLFLRGPNKSL